MGYHSGARKARLTSKDYLEVLGGKLGFPQGALYNLRVAAVKLKVEAKEGITVTYRGVIIRQKTKREVIGQILEYAAFLHEKEVDWLDAVAQKKTGASIAQHFEKEDRSRGITHSY